MTEPAAGFPEALDRELDEKVQQFAQSLIETCSSVLGQSVSFTIAIGPTRSSGRHVTVTQSDQLGIPLHVDGELVFRLLVSFRCSWNESQHFFAIQQSQFVVRLENASEPLMHFDYIREAGALVPVAHVNLHAHRDELIFALMNARRNRGKARAKDSAKGVVPRVADIHIPLGGHRFRPALEDVLEMMIQEFGIERAPGAMNVIAEGRQRFRSIQVSASVSDDPEAAAEALVRLGYSVTPPNGSHPPARQSRLQRY